MFGIIIRSFIEEVMVMCLDSEIESNEIPNIMIKMLLEIGDEGDAQKLFEEISKDCNLDPYGNAVNQLEIYEVVCSEIGIYLERELSGLTYKYQDVGYSYEEAKDRAANTDYIKHISTIIEMLDVIIKEFRDEFEQA